MWSSCHAGTTRARSSRHAHTWHSSWARNSLLLWPSRLSSYLSRGEESLRLWHSWHKVSSHSHLLHTTHMLNILTGQVCFTVLLPLSQSHIQGLRDDDPTIHLRYCLGSFLGGGEAHKPKSLRATFLIHNLSRSNSSVRSKFLPKSLI